MNKPFVESEGSSSSTTTTCHALLCKILPVSRDLDLANETSQISTHNGQGTTALRSHFEGMVFSGRTVPTLQQNEQGLQRQLNRPSSHVEDQLLEGLHNRAQCQG
jgi:hypothetical protein